MVLVWLPACVASDDGDGGGGGPTTVSDLPGNDAGVSLDDAGTGGTDAAGQVDTGGGGTVDTGGGGTVDTGGGGTLPPLTCASNDLGSTFPATQSGSTAGAPSAFTDSGCGGDSGRSGDAVFVWQAPSAGRYVFSTTGSGFDTILYALADCSGRELACNDDAHSDLTSKLELDLEANQRILIVVDGFGGNTGDYRLSVGAVEQACDNGPDDDRDGAADCADDDCISADCAGTGAWPDDWASLEQQMLTEVNNWRATGVTCGETSYPPRPALEMDETIRIAARLHSKDMGDQNYFEHDSLDGREFDDRMTDVGFRGASPWGENIQAGSSTAADSTQRLINSEGHCHNIMSIDYRTVGIGYAFVPGSEYGHYWTQDFAASH